MAFNNYNQQGVAPFVLQEFLVSVRAEIVRDGDLRMEEEHLDVNIHQLNVSPPVPLRPIEQTSPTYDAPDDNDMVISDSDTSQSSMASQSTGLDEPASPSIHGSAGESPQRSIPFAVAETYSRQPTPHPKTLPPITRMKLGPVLQTIVEAPLCRSKRRLSSPASTLAKRINASPRPTKRKFGKSLTPTRKAKRARSCSSSAS